MSKILMTGYRGFTGTHLAAALRDRGHEVFGLIREVPHTTSEQQADLQDGEAIYQVLQAIKPDYIVHLAAISHVAHSNIEDFYKINVLGTLNLLTAIKKAYLHPQKIIIASSANVYGNPLETPLTEVSAVHPENDYGNSKLAMENLTKFWFEEFPIIITRPFNYTGPGQVSSFLIPKLMAHYNQAKKTVQLGNLAVVRDISDINFVVACYVKLLESEVHSSIMNICSGVGYSLMELIQLMNKIAGYEIEIQVNQEFIRENEIKTLVGSNKKLLSAIGEVKAPPIEETLRSMYQPL